MSGFTYDNFLGGMPNDDIRAEIEELSDKSLFIDGTKSMAGTLGLSGNSIIGASNIQVQELASGILPASGHVSIYAKNDSKLYIQDDAGTETIIDTGVGGDVSGPGSSVANQVALFNDNTGSTSIS